MTLARGPVRVAAYWGFIVIGAGNTLLGPALLSILGTYHIAPSGSGPLFLAATLGYLLAVLIGGPAGDRWDRRLLLLGGAALYVVGALGFALAPIWILAVLAAIVMGLGGGVIDSGTNALANDIASPEGHATEQSLLHTFFGVGALLGPLLIGACLALHAGWRPAYAVTALAAVVLCGLLSRLRLPARATTSTPVGLRSVLTLAAHPLILMLGLMLGVYVGAELLVGDWAATFLQRIHHLDNVAAATGVGLYWGGLAGGRLLSALLTRWFTGGVLLTGSTVLSLVASIGLVLAPNAPLALVALTATGVGYAAIFPLAMAVAGEVFPEFTGSAAGLLIASASVMGAIFPWLGGVLVQYADARAAMVLALPAAVVMLALALVLQRQHHATTPSTAYAA